MLEEYISQQIYKSCIIPLAEQHAASFREIFTFFMFIH